MIRTFQATCLKFALAGAALALALPAHAEIVKFSSTGIFTCTACTGSTTNTVTFGNPAADSLTLSFAGINNKQVNLKTSTMINVPFSNTSFGTVTVSTTGNGAAVSPGTTFNLGIHQFTPNNAVGNFIGAASGSSISTDNSDGAIDAFNKTSLVLSGVSYSLLEQSTDANGIPGYDLEPPDTNSGRTSIQGQIRDTALPEPSFMMLSGLAFAGLSMIAYRRRQRA